MRRTPIILSIQQGAILQLAGLLLAAAGLEISTRTTGLLSLAVILSSWMLVYLSCHAIAHWIVGRLLGIRFQYFTLKRIFLGVRTEKQSLLAASKTAQSWMWRSGALSSVLSPILFAWLAWSRGVPSGRLVLLGSIAWSIGTFVSNFRPGGDFYKARLVNQN